MIRFDEDGDGKISREELGSLMRDLTSEADGLSEADLDQWLLELDLDGNGTLDYDEFSKVFDE